MRVGLTHLLTRGLLSLSLLTGGPSTAQAPTGAPTPTTGRSGGMMATSASVMVTYRTRVVRGVEELELLILWRGTPGWFANGGGGSSRGSGNPSQGTWSSRFAEGGHTFEISGNTGARTANILGKTYDLTDVNTVLVDGVDAPEGARVVRTLMIDGRLPEGPGDPRQIFTLLGRSQEVREYLRCDTRMPNQALQERLAPICAQIRGK